MMAQLSETEIANKPFILLGTAQRISNINDTSVLATQIRECWQITVPAILADHPWNFALRRVQINRDGDYVPETLVGQYRYRLPQDCLRWLPPDRGDADWFDAQEESGFLLCDDEGPIVVRYIGDERDITRWSALFIDALCYKLAYELSESVSADQSLRDRMEAGYEAAIGKARSRDGLATGRTQRQSYMVRSRLIASRHRPAGYGY